MFGYKEVSEINDYSNQSRFFKVIFKAKGRKKAKPLSKYESLNYIFLVN